MLDSTCGVVGRPALPPGNSPKWVRDERTRDERREWQIEVLGILYSSSVKEQMTRHRFARRSRGERGDISQLLTSDFPANIWPDALLLFKAYNADRRSFSAASDSLYFDRLMFNPFSCDGLLTRKLSRTQP